MFERDFISIALYWIMHEEAISSQTYKDAGVDIAAGNALVEAIKPLVAKTSRAGSNPSLGGFGGLFDLAQTGFRDPVLVAATDGVGTKLRLAIETGQHGTIGIDLVAMCVNDLVVQGAEPLFFLDYFATGKLDIETAKGVISGIAEGCRESGCALIGGETAEMPGMYGAGDYDLAGFAVGAVERDSILSGEKIRQGDVVLGLASSGVHANGYSLVRAIVAQSGLSLRDRAPFSPGQTLGEALLAPTRIYVASLLAALKTDGIHAMAHITGGGLSENIPRVLPEGLAVSLDTGSWTLPDVFAWLAREGGIAAREMALTFNCGIGMAVVAAPEKADALRATLIEKGETVFTIGVVTKRDKDAPIVVLQGAEENWPQTKTGK